VIASSREDTKQFAFQLARGFNSPQVLALYGDLGSGKTTFVQFLAEALAIEARIISPTFVLLRSYLVQNKPFKNLHHFDLYRVRDKASALTSGIEEILKNKDSIVVIEWPEVIEELLPKETLRIRFKNLGGDKREIESS
jgi:tRNA threonylcarbamoyladenosine biosynthesis protein TsaE